MGKNNFRGYYQTSYQWGTICLLLYLCEVQFLVAYFFKSYFYSEKYLLNLIAVGNATKSLLNLIALGNATKAQSDPPRVPIAELFPNANYPEGEVMNYKDEYETILL